MKYRITNNLNLLRKGGIVNPEFTARSWDSAIKKVADAIKADKDLYMWLLSHNKTSKSMAASMLVELGKD